MTTKKAHSELLTHLGKLASGGRNLTGPELNELIQKAQDEYSQVAVRERQELKEQIQALAADKGIDLKDLFAKRYVNPRNPAQVWGGKGPHPQWLKDLEAEGVQLEALEEGFSGEVTVARASASQNGGKHVSASASKASRVYRNPANPSETYTRGPHPKWVKEHIKKGGTLDELAR